ncbi:MAG: RNA polymerase sigma-70 factor [Salinivenus sp.]
MPDAPPFDKWCRRLKASDRAAYADLFDAMYEPLFRYVRSITQSPEVARDVAQDTFVRLWEVRESLDPDRSLEAYLYRIARNRAYNHERNRRTRTDKEDAVRDQTSAQPAPPARPDAQADAAQFADRLWRWIGELTERQREALVLTRFDGLSHEEAADVMDISPRTVNNHIVRALRTLRDRVHDYEPNLLDRDEH